MARTRAALGNGARLTDFLSTSYHERWEVEGVFDEVKTHLHQRRRVLRSKKPDLVRQEFYGWVLAHYAVRWLPYASHDRALLLNWSQIFHPELLPPLALTRRKRVYAGEKALI